MAAPSAPLWQSGPLQALELVPRRRVLVLEQRGAPSRQVGLEASPLRQQVEPLLPQQALAPVREPRSWEPEPELLPGQSVPLPLPLPEVGPF